MVSFYELRRGSSTLLGKAACGVPVFFGVQGSSTLLGKAACGVPVFFGVQGSSTLLGKAACGVPVFFGVQGFEPAKAHLIRKSRLRLSASDLALCVTREMMQTAFSVFSKGKEISFLTWSSALPPVSQSADSLFLRLWLLPLSAPGSGRTQSPGNPSVAALKQKNTMLLHDAFSRIAETGFEDYPLRLRKGTPIIQHLHTTKKDT